MNFNKVITLVLCLPLIWSVIQCEGFITKPKCLPDCGAVKEQTGKFYCVATQIHKELKTLNLDLLQPVLSTKEFNKHSVSIMLDVFSDTCKIHTAVMMYKDQLEQYILKDQNNHLYSLSAVLQTAANILEGIEETSNKKACVEFAPEEYRMIYTWLYDERPLLASLMDQVKKWMEVDYYNSFGYSTLHFNDC